MNFFNVFEIQKINTCKFSKVVDMVKTGIPHSMMSQKGTEQSVMLKKRTFCVRNTLLHSSQGYGNMRGNVLSFLCQN